MSALDSAFLHVENATASLHIASVAVFEGPAPDQAEFQAGLARKLPAAPRCRQRMVPVPLGLGRPVWVDDPDFDIHNHVHRLAVPAPGGEAELRGVVEQLLSEPLDHDLPLWDDWVLEGLRDGRWALLTKVHHSMVDGIAGTDLLSTMLDSDPAGDPVEPDSWHPAPVPPGWRLATRAVLDTMDLRLAELRSLPLNAGAVVSDGVRHPRAAAGSVYAAARGALGYVGNLRPTAGSSLAGPIGRDRGYAWTEVDLATVLAVHDRLGGTVNDLVIAAVTHGFRELLLARGENPRDHKVRTLVPVSVRRPDQRGHLDNRVSAILLDLPVHLEDPHDRLTEVSIRMHDLKDSHEPQVGERITEIADAMPPMALAAMLHVAFRMPHRNLTTVITNVPGPVGRLYCLGRPMLATYPYVPIADRLRSGIAVTNYDDRLLFGLTTDRESMPDQHVLLDGIATGFSELADLAAVGTSARHAADAGVRP